MTGIPDEYVQKALREVPVKVLRDHEQIRGGCKCGAGIGDGIDWKWHVANQATIAAATFALEAVGLPALLERVEAAEGAYEYVVRERDEAIASALAAAACPRCAGLKVGLWMDLCDDHLITQLAPALSDSSRHVGGTEE